jgi:dihydroorotate dehydrogenase subfamily 2
MNRFLVNTIALAYQNIFKPTVFTLTSPEVIHEHMTNFGEQIGHTPLKHIFEHIFTQEEGYPALQQTINGINFKTPIGLAAGFDYEARLTQILYTLGFGFQSVGTITYRPYEGNPSPMLGRLPKSQSLMVNKGFKNFGVPYYRDKLKDQQFKIPLGISIGRSNTKQSITQKESVEEIVQSFAVLEQANLKNSYYELNISCPNLYGDVSFYPPKNLEELLAETDKLHLTKPLWIKMPIEKSDKETLEMTEIIRKHNVDAVIIGNLQKNRQDPALHQDEVAKFKVGNFSGKATWTRSNELIHLLHKTYKKQLTIIGCGGVFNTQDAYTKIKLGASLIQLITGMIFQGPQLITQINNGLNEQIKKDGYASLSEAIGIAA